MNFRRDPAFCLALAALFALLFVLLYGGANLLAALVPWRIRPALPFEAAVPFVPAWSVVYLSLPLLLLLCGLRADRHGAWLLFAVLAAELAAALPFFVFLPVQTAWPPREAGGFWQPFFLLADRVSLSRNHLPSLHTAFALTAARFAWRQRFPARALYVLWAAAVVLSTLLIHEHHLADLAAGGLLAFAACRLVPARADGDAFRRADTAFLLLREQAAFARRHRRYALISLILALYRLRRPKRGGLMVAGYCFLQAFDDLMDGDRPLPPKACGHDVSASPVAEADRLISEWQRGVFDTHDHYSRLAACFRGRLNAVLPPDTAREAVFQTASLLHTMRRDRLRADAAEIWPAAALAAHHRATFADSLDLLFAAAGAATRSRNVPELADALAWCSVMRDLRQDLAAGIVNIPAEILNQAERPSENTGRVCGAATHADGGWQNSRPAVSEQHKPRASRSDTPYAAVQTASDRTNPTSFRPDFAALSADPAVHQWIRGERRRARALLDVLEPRAAALPDPASRRIACLFARSVRSFAEKRILRLYPWLDKETYSETK
ncbi:phosphoesterase [Neisseria sp. 23W00296]|uniref:phosphoesterase n=1 Tax=unclassified Neisseria TaxID=2623750 RepID=UPI003757DB42